MKLRVQYTGQLRTAIGRAEDFLEMPDGSTLERLLMDLADRCEPTARSHLVTDAGKPRPSLLIVVNGVAVPATGASRTIVKSCDEITLLPPIAGG